MHTLIYPSYRYLIAQKGTNTLTCMLIFPARQKSRQEFLALQDSFSAHSCDTATFIRYTVCSVTSQSLKLEGSNYID